MKRDFVGVQNMTSMYGFALNLHGDDDEDYCVSSGFSMHARDKYRTL